jgi:pimeloyl-ACP methyl ester carboxylesterase
MLRKVLLSLLTAVVVLYAAVCVVLVVYQRSLIYFPQPNANRAAITPMPLETPAGTMTVLTRPCPGQDAVLYFGGNGEDVSLDMPDLAGAFPTHSIYLLNYPGYGSSGGKPSEKAIMDAAFALFDRVHASHQNVVVIGRSLGTGVAVQLAAARPVSRLVLVTPFDSFADPAAAAYPYFPVRLLLRDKFESWRYAPQVTAPTRIIAAADDEIIPRASTQRLLTRFKPGVATYTVLPNANHNSISDNPDYWHLLAAP